MTSAVTIDDIEGELWKAGLRSARVIDDILRLVRLYKLASVRQEIPVPVLEPGGSDPGTMTAKCVRCLKVKNWSQFLTSVKGRSEICRTCLKDADAAEDIYIRCANCGRTRHASDFYRRRDLASGYSPRCKDCHDDKVTCPGCHGRWDAADMAGDRCPPCSEGRRASGRYLCRKCNRRLDIACFPAAKAAHPAQSFWCGECTARFGLSRRRCPRCEKRQPLSAFGRKASPDDPCRACR